MPLIFVRENSIKLGVDAIVQLAADVTTDKIKDLRRCYLNSLKLAKKNGHTNIAISLISRNMPSYSQKEDFRVAIDAIVSFLQDNELGVYLIVPDEKIYFPNEKVLFEVSNYINANYLGYGMTVAESHCYETLDELIGDLDEPFTATLLRLIDAKGKSDVEVYKRANLDRRLFSKIRNNCDYMPSKRTILALAIALELSLSETDDLLRRAGFALSHSQVFDVIVEYFIIHARYDIFKINEVLFYYDQPLLGGNVA